MKPSLPGADAYEPTDIEFFLFNRLESRRSRDFRSAARTDFHRMQAGEHCWDDTFIIGRGGHSYGCGDAPSWLDNTCAETLPEIASAPAEAPVNELAPPSPPVVHVD
jgi:pilus assembly protein CpaC